jgi:hypothetical protein
LKSPYLRASYTKSVGPIKFSRLLFFKTLRRLGAIFETPVYIFEMNLRRDSRIQSSFVVVGVVKYFQQSKAFANNWIKQNVKPETVDNLVVGNGCQKYD